MGTDMINPAIETGKSIGDFGMMGAPQTSRNARCFLASSDISHVIMLPPSLNVVHKYAV